MNILFCILKLISITFYLVHSAPQTPEINDQFDEANHTETGPSSKTIKTGDITEEVTVTTPNIIEQSTTNAAFSEVHEEINDTALQIAASRVESKGFVARFYIAITKPLVQFISTPKVNVVLKNIGTCIVNGAMEIISYFFPAPLIPLIASAAGMVIPFEPVVMLRKRMPVTSYRRAFNSAVDSFMGTFDNYKTDDEDPYMTKRFNRRFLDKSKEKN